ncbi:hypothetical protein [Mesorhizobium sp.]|nr:hypothetical protein [Mesorhizobium sp.]
MFLSLRLALGSILFANFAAASASSPPGTFDFSHPENSGLIILLEDF